MTDSAPGPAFDELADAMAAVLDRCVWTQTMTHASLVTYLVEETYELVDAIESGTTDDVREELGDLLWQVVIHSEIASRTPGEGFDLAQIARETTAKMVRRHPHVFGDETAETTEDVLRVWNAAKAAEKRQRRSVLDGIPQSMPALALADKVLGRAARVGVVPEAPLRAAADGVPRELDDEATLGEALLAIVADARSRGLDAERALRFALRDLQSKVREAEATPTGTLPVIQ